MRLYLFLLIAFLPAIARTQQLPGQHILFYQLNTSHGLSDNYIHSMTVDKTGNLWIATGDGLNVFNGKTVKRYFSNEYPALKNDFYRQVLCDEKNRIWALADSGHVTIIDENRKFRYIDLADEKGFLPTRRIIQTKSKGIVLLTWRGQYSFDEKKFTRLTFSGPDTLPQIGFRQVKPFGEDDYLLVDFEGFYKVDYANAVVRKFTLSNIMALEKLPGGELLYYDEKVKQLRAFDFETGKISKPFAEIKDQLGNEISALINNACWISPGRLFLSTHKKGFYIYDFSARKLVNYRHDPADPSSVINNSPSAVTIDQSGWVFIGATPNGVSYFKSNAVIGEKQIFQDKKGQIYDGYINNLNSLDNETFYIGVSENVVIWNRPTNRSWFLENENDNKHWLKGTDVNHIAFDDRERIWVTASARGIRVYDKSHKIIASIQEDTSKAGSLPSNYIRHMEMGPDGYMWLSTRHGVCRVNTTNYKIEFPLAELYKVPCYRTWFPNPGEVWIATDQAGAWHYDLAGKRLTKYTTANGLTSNTTYCINGDKFNNIYIGTNKGLDIKLNNGKWKKISVAEGLLNKRIEALLLDRNGRMWIGNDVAIACFNIADTSVKVFDERYGLSVQGFRINSYFQASTDELIWGTEKGLQYFYPEQLLQQRVSLPGTITRIETPDYTVDLTSDASFRLGAGNNSVTFHFSAIDYSKHLRTFYEYKLEGADEQWTRVTDQNSVRYTSLPAGDYIFRLRTSNDSKVWEDAGNSVVLKIAKPVWQQTWFRAAGILVGIMLIWFVINFYRRRQRLQREELETEGVINYFASRINRHHETEDILWDIAKNCISKLQFEDCVIYLLDEERNVLVQKAAYGPKMERDFTIYQPIEIPLGRGIVGSVAMSGKPEIIANTDLDPRYIADDAKRHSEVAVPLIIDGKVIGVIDSENSKRNFFNQKHLNILSTIAVLCCNQIQRAKAEKEKQQAKIEVLQNRQKVMESRLQSLRLQMNPHFLFNALNSIQQMILANEEMVATRYLSRFSKLLRTILVHSDKEVVTLKEELEILNLYVELEAVRFRDSFNFRISCDENIDQEEVFVPTLLVQPFVENAIWHGLMHKEGNRQLQVRFEEADDFLSCIVEDNGVGREQAKLIRAKSMNGKTHTSKGIQVSLERLRAMRNDKGETGSLLITDLVDANGEAAGTRVEIKFPVLN